MKLNDYQEWTRETAIYTKTPGLEAREFTSKLNAYDFEVSLSYLLLGLSGEAGELANKYKKVLRGDAPILRPSSSSSGYVLHPMTLAVFTGYAKELGDVLWYVARLADELGFSLEDVAKLNQEKLMKRKEENKLRGTGDER